MKAVYVALILVVTAVGCKSKQKASNTSAPVAQSAGVKDLPKAPEKDQQMQLETVQPESELYNIETELMPMLKKYGVNSWKEVSIAIEKTPCYGRCPAYRVAFLTDGRIFYQGIRNVTFVGDYQCMLGNAKVEALQQQLVDLDFFTLNTRYDMGATDLPSTHFYLNYKGRNKSVEARQGAPIGLRDYATALEEIVNNCGLKKADISSNE